MFARKCERKFGGNPPHRGRGVPKILLFFLNIFAHMQILVLFFARRRLLGSVIGGLAPRRHSLRSGILSRERLALGITPQKTLARPSRDNP